MSRLWILPFLGLLPILALACGDSGDDNTPTVYSTAPVSTATASATLVPTSTPTSTGWQTYSSADYGFSFEYPAGWYLDVHGSHPDTTMDYVAVSNFNTHQPGTATFLPGTIRFEFYLGDRGGLSLEDWVAGNRAPLGDSEKVVTSDPLVIDGNEGLEQTVSYYCCDATSDTPAYVDLFEVGNFVLMIGGLSIDSPDLPMYRQILQSLTFENSAK